MAKRRCDYNVVGEDTTNAQENDHLTVIDPPTKVFHRRSRHGHLFWTEISWRFMAVLVFSTAITVIRYTFSLKGVLSHWEKRWFNILTILFSSLVSLSLGSLLGLLGSMLRWLLLARKVHKPVDVDLILGMSNPTGSLKLVWYHTVKDRKWTATTVVVMIYLLVNMAGRLSVAAFGLTFDLNEQPGIEYPIKVTDWSTDAWFNHSSELDYDLLEQHCKQMNSYATVGLSTVPTQFESKDLSSYNSTNLTGQGLDRLVDEDTVTYSYFLKEYRGLQVNSSKTEVLHSSSKCIGRTLLGQDVYENGEIVGSLNTTTPDSAAFLKILKATFIFYPDAQEDYLWMKPLNYAVLLEPSACATTYLYTSYIDGFTSQFDRNATYFECKTCLTDKDNNEGLGSNELFGLPSGNSSIIANLLLHLGVFERVFDDPAIDPNGTKESIFALRSYSAMDKMEHYSNNLHSGLIKGGPWTNVPTEAKIYAAHLAARLPLLAIIGADMRLPKVTQEPGASERPFVATVLKVQWKRPIAVLLAILVGEILAIGIVQFACRNVFVRDYASHFSVARLLKTAMEKVDGMSTHTGEQLSEYMEREGVVMRYGTRRKDEVNLEVDLWNDVENEFSDATYG